MTTIHVVDDDAALLRSLRWLLESAWFNVETYASGDEFLARYQVGGEAECLVLDLSMPGVSGLDIQAACAERGWRTPIIFLTGHGTVHDAVNALKLGAFDFFEKPFDDDALLDRIRAALEEDRKQRAARAEDEMIAARIANLTKREYQVAMRVAAGLPNKVIAIELGISPRTVEVYRAKVMTKTGATSTAALVKLVMRQRPDVQS